MPQSSNIPIPITFAQDSTPAYESTGNAYVFEMPSVNASVNNVDVLGDFCAKNNFMKEAFAKTLGLSIDRNDITNVAIGSGRRISTTGKVVTSFRFQNEPEVYSLEFHLLPECIHNIILGKGFLKATKTFSFLAKKARRLVRRVIKGLTRHFLYLGD
jgi:hypothetical protein